MEHNTYFVHELQRLTCNAMPTVALSNILVTDVLLSTKTIKTSRTFATTRMNLVSMLCGLFFATSHGKSPCDGIVGTVKRQIARASLHRPLNDQILTFDAVKKICETIKGVYQVSIHYER